MKDNLKYTLQKLILIKDKYDLLRNNEEQFNIFSIMYKEHDERRLHSRFIASILNPLGSHGLKKRFLEIFISLFEEIEFSKFSNAIVYPEEKDKRENNNIDILIIDRISKNAIIIENKIYAGDSNSSGGQLERYVKHVRDIEKIPIKSIRVFYLTLDGHSPSNESIGEFKTLEKINGKCISYEEHILKWIERCIKEVVDKPILRETFQQYKKIINKMTNNETNIEERLKIKEIIASNKDTLTSTKYLIDNFKHVKWHTIFDFWSELEIELKKKGYEIADSVDESAITQITHYEINKKEEECGIIFKTPSQIEGFVWHGKNDWLFWGFEKKGIDKSILKILQDFTKEGFIEENDSFWWNYFEFQDNDKLWLKNFENNKTFQLIDADFRKETIQKLVDDISKFIKKITAANKR